MLRLLALNGSVRGATGNTARLLDYAATCVQGQAQLHTLHLATCADPMQRIIDELHRADGFLLGSGVYWNSHGAPLQRFLEVITGWETTEVFMGKPVACLLTVDSVGGTEVAARLQGALNLMGCWAPPLSTVLLSRVGQQAHDRDDVYGLDDVAVLMRNLCRAAQTPRPSWEAWPVRRAAQPAGTYASSGALDLDRPPWLQA